LLDRGWTGHEYFAVVHLVHMNGRMYDTDLRRFLSPDNYVQDPTNTQNYNRYQYGYNNPLKYSDPSGEFFFAALIVGAIIGAFVGAGSYVVNAIKTGHWSWKGLGSSILKGAIGGGISSLIPIGGVASGLLSTGIGGTIGMGILANSLPSLHIPIGDFSIDISPAIAFGKSFSIGANIRASYRDGNFNASVGFGVSFAGRAAGSGARGWEYRRSFGAGWDDGHQGFGVYSTIFSGFGGKFNQQIGGLSYRNGDFGFRYENDGTPFSKWSGDGGDKYRTAALAINIGEFSAGINLYTGMSGTDESGEPFDKAKGDNNLVSWEGRKHGYWKNSHADDYRLGALSLGYRGYHAGVNSEHVRNLFQNIIAHNISPQPGFRMLSRSVNPYFQYQSYNPYTLW